MSVWGSPVAGGYVTSSYGPRRSPGGVGSTWHRGIDLGGRGTDWLVRSVGPGTVLARGSNAVRGLWVAVRHDDGTTTAYQHLADVRASGRVSAGTVLGRMGQTGTSTATHLHMETFPAGRFVRVADAFASTDRAVDPEPYLLARGVRLSGSAAAVSRPTGSLPTVVDTPVLTPVTPITPLAPTPSQEDDMLIFDGSGYWLLSGGRLLPIGDAHTVNALREQDVRELRVSPAERDRWLGEQRTSLLIVRSKRPTDGVALLGGAGGWSALTSEADAAALTRAGVPTVVVEPATFTTLADA